MSEAGLLNAILGNDSVDGPSATQMTGILGNVGGSPPDAASSVNLTPWNPAGFDSIAPLPLPQLPDSSAALLPSSAFAPSQPLYDPTPFAPPDLTMDQLATMYGMSPDQVAAIGNQAKLQAVTQVGSKYLVGPAAEFILPELGVPRYAARMVALAADTANRVSEPSDEQFIRDAPNRALFNSRPSRQPAKRGYPEPGSKPCSRHGVPILFSSFFASGSLGDIGMADSTTLFFAGITLGVMPLVIASLSSIRALDSLAALIWEKRPDLWATRGDYGWRVSPGDSPALRYPWVSWLVLGFIKLDVPEGNYWALLWTARKRMTLCGLLFIAILAAVIWFSMQVQS